MWSTHLNLYNKLMSIVGRQMRIVKWGSVTICKTNLLIRYHIELPQDNNNWNDTKVYVKYPSEETTIYIDANFISNVKYHWYRFCMAIVLFALAWHLFWNYFTLCKVNLNFILKVSLNIKVNKEGRNNRIIIRAQNIDELKFE